MTVFFLNLKPVAIRSCTRTLIIYGRFLLINVLRQKRYFRLAQAIAQQIIEVLKIVPLKPKGQFNLDRTELLQFKMTQAEQYHQLETRAIPRRSMVKPLSS